MVLRGNGSGRILPGLRFVFDDDDFPLLGGQRLPLDGLEATRSQIGPMQRRDDDGNSLHAGLGGLYTAPTVMMRCSAA